MKIYTALFLLLFTTTSFAQSKLEMTGTSDKDSWITNYAEALDYSEWMNWPILLFFTDSANEKAQKMTNDILKAEPCRTFLEEHFIIVYLDVNDKTPLPEFQQYPDDDNNLVDTVGKRNKYTQLSDFRSTNQPEFYIVNHHENILAASAYETDPDLFLKFLTTGLETYKN